MPFLLPPTLVTAEKKKKTRHRCRHRRRPRKYGRQFVVDGCLGSLTLFGFEVREIPYHFADEELLAPEHVERLKVLGHEFDLVFFGPDERWALELHTRKSTDVTRPRSSLNRYHVQTGQRVGSVFRHENRLVVFDVPFGRFVH